MPRAEQPALARITGLPAVTALFARAPERVERLFFDERLRAAAAPFCTMLARARKPFRQLGGEELAKVAGTVLHGGIVAVARPQPIHAFDPAAVAHWARDGQPLLVLDGIGNTHNLGAIARTAAFFGLPRLLLSDHPAQALPAESSYRVAEGGLDQLELHRAAPFGTALQQLRPAYRTIAAAPGRHRDLTTLRRDERPFALVLGNEEDGLSKASLAGCDEIVAIPGGGRVQSLNVAASAAILLYALMNAARDA